MAAGISPRWQAQLTQDLASGAPIPYRRVPGRARRQYYNPLRPQDPIVTEHYVMRIYKPALSQLERQVITERSRANVQHQAVVRANLASTWMLREITVGGRYDITNINQALEDPAFERTYDQFVEQAWQARHMPIDDPNREALFAAGGPYHDLLVALGRRTGLETFPVGESPQHVSQGQSYIDTVVVPYLESQA